MNSRAIRNAFLYIWWALRAVGRLARRAIPRVYASAIMLVILWLTYLAVRYLVTSLAVPSGPPPQILALPTRLDRGLLGESRSAFEALAAAEHPRSPLAHYHRLDSWIQPDAFNDCTRSGCHNPLPHSKKKEVRAFLNMHATSIHCGVCHMQADQQPMPLAWYDLNTGRTRDPPAILLAYEILTRTDADAMWKADGLATQRRLVRLLRQAAGEAGNLDVLSQLADHFDAYRVGSAGFENMLKDGPDALARHFRGEYGAKLALTAADTGRPLLGHPNTRSAVETYLARKDSAPPDGKQTLLKAVHPLKRETALSCTDCHRTEGSLVNFTSLGYPEARQRAMIDPIVFRMIEHINAGRPFNLPAVIGGAPLPPPEPKPGAP